MSTPIAKSKLRKAMRARRRELAAACPDAAQRAADHLPLDQLPAFGCFSGYQPQGAELDPGPLLRRLASTGAVLALPSADRADGPLNFRVWNGRDALVPDSFGVPAPPPTAPLVRPDLIVCPLVAFDGSGLRLGQGGGHYDRTIEALRASGSVFVLGLAYAGQQVEAIAAEAHDQRLDAILTESGYMAVSKD
ncbi:5-formyltetrahydrofolate cyclo-ligase [Phenylobacterium sp. Root700]|uniref:5-formyltetrahydrofolate cyclo-ligase n=1 Tax=Phenylobacterium sp. Root700 TaxID=1736591 RepID=UPI000A7CA4F0|nr:5-formyltetrahydrofolate cyclo-ligase [Phenylobacterium sp. Root700]